MRFTQLVSAVSARVVKADPTKSRLAARSALKMTPSAVKRLRQLLDQRPEAQAIKVGRAIQALE